MQKLIKSLNKRISTRQAGTGTLYLEFNGKKVRIANHEPNDSMRRQRGTADLEIYTHDVVGKEINSKYDVVEKVADFYNLEIPGTVKAAITRFRNKQAEEHRQLQELIKKNKQASNKIQETIKLFHEKIRQLTKGKEKELKILFEEAEKYGAMGSNSDKRRKRTVSYFKAEFQKRFGIEASPSDVRSALDK